MRGTYGQRPPSSTGSNAPTIEKIIGGLCYLSAGLIGLLYIIVSGKSNQSQFFRFHFLQSIILGIMLLLLRFTEKIIVGICSGILEALSGPTGGASTNAIGYVDMGLGIVLIVLGLVPLYGMIFCFLGKYANIPFISDLVRRNM